MSPGPEDPGLPSRDAACFSSQRLKSHNAVADAIPMAIRISQPAALLAGTSSTRPT
jgi:hypothetical protein